MMISTTRASAARAPSSVVLAWNMSPTAIHQTSKAAHAMLKAALSRRFHIDQRPCTQATTCNANVPPHNSKTGHARCRRNPSSKANTCASGPGSAGPIHGRLTISATPMANHTRPISMSGRLTRSGSTSRGRQAGCHQPSRRTPAAASADITIRPGHQNAPRPQLSHHATTGWPANTRGRLNPHCSAIPPPASSANVRVCAAGMITAPGGW